MAALSRMSRGEHRSITLTSGDLIIMSSSQIPGNEEAIFGVLDSLAKIGRLQAPLLVIHGEADEVVPFAQGRAVFDAAPEPKTFVTLRGSRHYDLEAAWTDYWAAWRRFLASL